MDKFKIMPAAFFDLDGTIRTVRGKVFADVPEDYVLYPGVEEKLQGLRNEGYLICGVTNQGGVAYGRKTIKQLAEEISFTTGLFIVNPFHIIKACIFMEGGTVEPYNRRSLLRKPDIGMLVLCEYEAMKQNIVIDWTNSFMVGDRDEDEQCAQRAKIKFYWANNYFGRAKDPSEEVYVKFNPEPKESVKEIYTLEVEMKPRIILPISPASKQLRIENIDLPGVVQHESVINKDGTLGISPLNIQQLNNSNITDKDEDNE